MDNFDDYQEWTRETAVYPDYDCFNYLIMGLCGEAGEVANKYAKYLRDDTDFWEEGGTRDQIIKELGDVLWMLARLADELDEPLSEIAKANMDKLNSRKERGVIGGSGDDR